MTHLSASPLNPRPPESPAEGYSAATGGEQPAKRLCKAAAGYRCPTFRTTFRASAPTTWPCERPVACRFRTAWLRGSTRREQVPVRAGSGCTPKPGFRRLERLRRRRVTGRARPEPRRPWPFHPTSGFGDLPLLVGHCWGGGSRVALSRDESGIALVTVSAKAR